MTALARKIPNRLGANEQTCTRNKGWKQNRHFAQNDQIILE